MTAVAVGVFATFGLCTDFSFTGETASDDTFTHDVATFDTPSPYFDIQKIHIGETYWRIGASKGAWTPPIKINVHAHSIAVEPPRLSFASPSIDLHIQCSIGRFAVSADSSITAFVIEMSTEPTFPLALTQAR